jgi:TM2 domain-containing membrane protein YozV
MSTEPTSSTPIPSGSSIPGSEKKLVAGLLGILLTCLGIHKFYLGYTKEGLIMLLVSVLTCGVAAPVMGVIGLVEGIIYLTKTDAEFVATYVTNKKGWF